MAVGFPPLPDFDQPPVIEVVLSLQFEGVNLQIQHIGQLWERYWAAFPVVEIKPPLDPVVEDLRQPSARALRFELSEMQLLPRTWFVAAAGAELIQIQADRFIHNWRKTGEADAYPRYERIREQFAAELTQFMAFASDSGLGQLRPVQCEITYINHVPLVDGLSHGDVMPRASLARCRTRRLGFSASPSHSRWRRDTYSMIRKAGNHSPAFTSK